jgi:DNA-binding NtrC family response regulator
MSDATNPSELGVGLGAESASLESGPRVFVVDDEPLIAEFVASVVEMIGLQAVIFQDPQALWDAFVAANPRPKLLVTDYAMRPFNGMELIERCKRIEPGLKTILFSGLVDEDVAVTATTKPDRFLRKPLQLGSLSETLRHLLGI